MRRGEQGPSFQRRPRRRGGISRPGEGPSERRDAGAGPGAPRERVFGPARRLKEAGPADRDRSLSWEKCPEWGSDLRCLGPCQEPGRERAARSAGRPGRAGSEENGRPPASPAVVPNREPSNPVPGASNWSSQLPPPFPSPSQVSLRKMLGGLSWVHGKRAA